MKNIYMAGGAWGMIYQLGAISKLRETIRTYNPGLYGCSAGALSLILMMLYEDAYALELYLIFVKNVHTDITADPFKYANYNLTLQHFKIFDIMNRDHPNAYLAINGRVNVGITTERGFEWYNTFESNADMFNKLLCSFHVPFLCSYNAKLGKSLCVDGGFGIVHMRDLPEDCLVIRPKDYDPSPANHKYLTCNIPVLFCIVPPPDFLVLYYYEKGAEDVVQYLESGKTTPIVSSSFGESSVPINLWWLLRVMQPIDELNVISRFK